MALPTSGTLTLADIQTEFGGSNPIGLSEYYAGGSYVPAGTSGTNGAVPSSGTISISDFYGTGVQRTVTVSPTSQSATGTSSSHTWNPVTVTYSGGTPSSVVWSFSFTNGGTFSYTTSNGGLTATPSVSGVVDSCSGTLVCTVTFANETKTASCFLSYLVTSGGGGGEGLGGGGGFDP